MSERIIISVNEGKIRGVKETSLYSGVEFFSFYGVRYGQPPLNNLRFKDPKPIKPWKDLYDATIKKPGCVQFSLKLYVFLGNEDCLFNNIHIPKLPVKGAPLKPVIINLHPGGFMFGTPNSDDYGSPQFVMHHDVVYINIGHRLHILGYLNLGLNECSGNQALKDVILSLQWIKCNIQAFGGDPENITLLGSSSGGTIIHALMISPAAKALPFEETNHHRAYEIAEMLGYTGNIEDKKALLSFLRKIQPEILIECQRSCAKKFQEKIAPLYPIGVFNISFDQGDIFPESPRTMMHSVSRIPIMIGFCQYESMMGFSKGLRRQTVENFLTSVRQNCWGWGRNLSDKDIDYINQRINAFYTEGKSIENVPLSLQADIQTDIILSDLYDSLVDIIADDLPSSVFVYKFEFEGDIPTTKSLLKHNYDEELPGSYHACDFSYWNYFYTPGDEITQQMVEYFTKFITNFARTGNPNSEDIPIEWEPTSPDKPCYLSINDPLKMVNGKLKNDGLEFWQDIKKHLQNK
ncbi:esterase E4-like isoform X2 [Planococcus citri]|uniref:esterase E4-like isoform X2 n=1 Tax=Planococcus citri TaxID=170843 RepID=UPI0031FA03DB